MESLISPASNKVIIHAALIEILFVHCDLITSSLELIIENLKNSGKFREKAIRKIWPPNFLNITTETSSYAECML